MVLSKITAAHAASERSRLIYAAIESGAYDLLKYYRMAHLHSKSFRGIVRVL